MIYREFGKTGKRISALSMGGMRFSEPHKVDKMAEIPLAAADAGINYFDTAPHYCDDKSEDIMGTAVPEMKQRGHKFYMGSKTNSKTYDGVWRDIEKTLKRLNIDKIDFYYCWCIITRESFEERKNGGAVKALMEIKEQGLADHINVSSHQSGEEIKELVDSGYFEGILLGYNILNFPFREQGIEAAYKKDMGIFIMNPLGGGIITDPVNRERFEYLKLDQDKSLLETALHFLLLNNKITSALTGFTTLEDVKTAVKTVDSFESVKDTDLESYKQEINQGYSDLCTTCRYCEYCPEGIPVSKLMEAYNYYIIYNKNKEVTDRLKWHWDIQKEEALELIDKCTSCGTCENKCTQQLPIIERLKEMKTMIS